MLGMRAVWIVPVVVSILILGGMGFPQDVFATLIYESATLGSTGQISGLSVGSNQFLGSKFSITKTFEVSAIGGHIGGLTGFGGDVFGAIVKLSGPSALPTGSPFTGSEVLASTVFIPDFPSSDVSVPLSVILTPGDYAIIFGSGLFGATGGGFMRTVDVDTPEGSGSYFFWEGNVWAAGGFNNVRFTVNGSEVPPEGLIQNLISEIEGLELSKPSEKSLTQKLNAAIKFLTDKNEDNDLNSCNKLDDFVNLVNAQEGKGLSPAQTDSLRDSAQEIKTSIGCPDTPPPPGCPNPSHLGFVFEGEITSISDPENLLGGIIAEGETWSTFYCLDKKTPDTNPSTAFQYEIDFIAITIGDNDEFVCTEAQILGIESGATFGTYQVFCFGMTPPVLPPFTQSTFNIFLGTTNAGLLDGSIPKFAPDLNDFDLGVLLNWNIGDFPNESEVSGTITSFVKVQ